MIDSTYFKQYLENHFWHALYARWFILSTTTLAHADANRNVPAKSGFTLLRTQIYAVYVDHCAHLGRVFSATNDDLRRRDRAGAECKHTYNAPFFMRGCWIFIG